MVGACYDEIDQFSYCIVVIQLSLRSVGVCPEWSGGVSYIIFGYISVILQFYRSFTDRKLTHCNKLNLQYNTRVYVFVLVLLSFVVVILHPCSSSSSSSHRQLSSCVDRQI